MTTEFAAFFSSLIKMPCREPKERELRKRPVASPRRDGYCAGNMKYRGKVVNYKDIDFRSIRAGDHFRWIPVEKLNLVHGKYGKTYKTGSVKASPPTNSRVTLSTGDEVEPDPYKQMLEVATLAADLNEDVSPLDVLRIIAMFRDINGDNTSESVRTEWDHFIGEMNQLNTHIKEGENIEHALDDVRFAADQLISALDNVVWGAKGRRSSHPRRSVSSPQRSAAAHPARGYVYSPASLDDALSHIWEEASKLNAVSSADAVQDVIDEIRDIYTVPKFAKGRRQLKRIMDAVVPLTFNTNRSVREKSVEELHAVIKTEIEANRPKRNRSAPTRNRTASPRPVRTRSAV